jgi:hypothetical protein
LISAGGAFGLEFVGLKAPELDQLANAGVEEVLALRAELLGFANESSQFGRDLLRSDQQWPNSDR